MTVPTLAVFDLDDTLYEYAPCDAAGRAALARLVDVELGVKASVFQEAFTEARAALKKRLGAVASSHSRLLYCHEALELIGLRSEPQLALLMEQTYWRNYLVAAELRPGAVDLLSTLQYRSITTAIVTDLTAQIQFRKLVHLDLARHIDHVVTSEEAPTEKIGLTPFEVLLGRVSEDQRQHVWFVGDQPFDAPVQALVDRGLIGGGRSFVRHPDAGEGNHHWRRISEVERELERELADS